MDATSDGYMRTGEIWVPDCVADGLAVHALCEASARRKGACVSVRVCVCVVCDGCWEVEVVCMCVFLTRLACCIERGWIVIADVP